MSHSLGAICVFALAASLPAQPPSFEVASIKMADPDVHKSSINILPGGGLSIRGTHLRTLVAFAWGLRCNKFNCSGVSGAAAWMTAERYDIEARPPAPDSDPAQARLRLRSLLTERFQLATHSEQKEMSGYLITIAKHGHKLQPAARDAAPGSVKRKNAHLTISNLPLSDLADALADITGRPVADRTGLTGNYDLRLRFAPETPKQKKAKSDAAAIPNQPSIFTAIQEQLGLKLEPAKLPVAIIVIEHAERASAN